MCNKVKTVTTHVLRKHFGGTIVVEGEPPEYAGQEEGPELTTGFDRPGMPVMVSYNPQRWVWMEWGLLPRNLDSMPGSKAMEMPLLNAKAETIFDLPSFRDSIRYRRCIIPIEGFFEHQHREEEVPGKGKRTKKVKSKQAYYIAKDDGLTFVAGIWDEYKGRKTFAKITTAANPLMAEIHNSKCRQPHIIDKENWEAWFAANNDDEVRALLNIYPDTDMRAEEYNTPKPPPPPAEDTDGTPTLFPFE